MRAVPVALVAKRIAPVLLRGGATVQLSEASSRALAQASGYFPVVSTLTLSTAFTRMWILIDPLLRGAVWHSRDLLSVVLLAASLSLSAFVTTFSLLERHYTELLFAEVEEASSEAGAQKLAQLDALHRRFDWMRRAARNALWSSLLLLLAAACYRVSALALLPAVVLGAGMLSVVATVIFFRAAYYPTLDRV